MTVTTSTARVAHNGNGTTTQFAVPFRFLENAHVAVFLRDAAGGQVQWNENTQYTLTGANEAAGGTLTAITAPTDYTPSSGEKLVVVRAVPITQETDYVENDPFPSDTHERALDKLTMVNQEQTERLGRTFTIPEADTSAGNFVLPIDTVRANMFLAFDGSGGPVVAAGTSANLGPVSAYVETLLTAADAPTARVILEAQKDVVAARGDLVVGDATSAASRLAIGTAGQRLESDGAEIAWVTPRSDLPRSYLAGIQTSNNAVDPTNDIDFTSGICRSGDDTENLSITAQTRAIDAVFVEGGVGFRDSTDDLIGAKSFHLYAIGGAGKSDDLFASTKLAPTLPTGFTYSRRVFSRIWTGAAWELGKQFGDQYIKDVAVTDDNTSNPGTSARTVTLTTPLGIRVLARLYHTLQSNAGPQTSSLVTSLDIADTAPSTAGRHQLVTETSPNSGNFPQACEIEVWTNTSSQVRARVSASSSVVKTRLHTAGWADRRGQDD